MRENWISIDGQKWQHGHGGPVSLQYKSTTLMTLWHCLSNSLLFDHTCKQI